MINSIVILQLITFVSLGIAFTVQGNGRLGVAQICYAVATGVLFYGK